MTDSSPIGSGEEEEEENNNEEEEEEDRTTTSGSEDEDEDNDNEENDDDEDEETSSEEEEEDETPAAAAAAAVAPAVMVRHVAPKMRIKLKLSKAAPPPPFAATVAKSGGMDPPPSAQSAAPSTTATAPSPAAPKPEGTTTTTTKAISAAGIKAPKPKGGGGGGRKRPSLPLSSTGPKTILKKKNSTDGGAGKSRFRTLIKLPLVQKPSSTIVRASSAGSDDDDGTTAVMAAEVVSSTTTTPTTATTVTTKSSRGVSSGPGKRRSHPSRPVRIPPLPSPGLLVPGAAAATSSSSSVAGGSSHGPPHNHNTTNNNNHHHHHHHGAANNNNPKTNPSGGGVSTAATAGYTTAQEVFREHMTQAGYTLQAREQHPHRGSSVERTVGDMFDSNVVLTRHFPPLVPPDLWQGRRLNKEQQQEQQQPPPETPSSSQATAAAKGEEGGSPTAMTTTEKENTPDKKETTNNKDGSGERLPDLLIQALRQAVRKRPAQDNVNGDTLTPGNAKRCRFFSLGSMLPVSLTTPYPQDYLEKRLHYVHQVEAREGAIVARQEAKEDAEMRVYYSDGDEPKPPLPTIPPIPIPPEAPEMKNVPGFDDDKTRYEDRHPLYPPKKADELVAHLDPQCFDVTADRYFGLFSNGLADPNFCGPNAPGMASVSASGGAGLATASSSGGAAMSPAMLILTSSSFRSAASHTAAAAAAATTASGGMAGTGGTTDAGNAVASGETDTNSNKDGANALASPNSGTLGSLAEGQSSLGSGIKANKTGDSPHKDTTDVVKTLASEKSSPAAKKAGPPKVLPGPTPTATATDLRKYVEMGGDAAEAMRDAIIRAAVYASRCGGHAHSFVGPNGHVYPDVSRAFAVHAGVKPCSRCKNNKQGAYHCRLRRRHQDLDFDEGDSAAQVRLLFETPLEELLLESPSQRQSQDETEPMQLG